MSGPTTKRFYSETHKECIRCNSVKSLEEFPVHSMGLLGRHTQCRQCRSELRAGGNANRERKWRNKILADTGQKECTLCTSVLDVEDFRNLKSSYCFLCESLRARVNYVPRPKTVRIHYRHRLRDGQREKLCTDCNAWKAISAFSTKGQGTYQHWRRRCKPCEAAEQRHHRKELDSNYVSGLTVAHLKRVHGVRATATKIPTALSNRVAARLKLRRATKGYRYYEGKKVLSDS